MGTYCGNHVMEQIREYCPKAKNGEVTIKKTNKGSCGHMGGCVTAHDDLFELKYDYKPAKEDVAAAKEAAEIKAEEEEKLKAENLAKMEAEEEAAGDKEATTATEKTASDTGEAKVEVPA